MRGIRWKRNSWSKYTADEMNWNVIVTWILYGRGPRGSTLPWNAVRKCAVRRERSDGGLKNSLKNELTLTWEWEGKKKVRERNRRIRFYSFANELSLLFFCLPSFGVVAFPRWYVCANLASLDSIRFRATAVLGKEKKLSILSNVN